MTKLYGIGVGPGDSELLTMKAVKALQSLDIIYTPFAHKGQRSVAEKIASPYFKADLVIKRRHFPMTLNLTEKEKKAGK